MAIRKDGLIEWPVPTASPMHRAGLLRESGDIRSHAGVSATYPEFPMGHKGAAHAQWISAV